MQYGIPQGTALVPVLFSVYINGLLLMPRQRIVSSFANNTIIIYEGETWGEVKSTTQKDLPIIKSWFDEMTLTIDFGKTK